MSESTICNTDAASRITIRWLEIGRKIELLGVPKAVYQLVQRDHIRGAGGRVQKVIERFVGYTEDGRQIDLTLTDGRLESWSYDTRFM